MAGARSRLAPRAILVAIALTLPTLVAAHLSESPPPIAITLDGHTVLVAAGARLGDVLTRFHARPRDGRLLAVDGSVLQRGVEPGHVLVDGIEALDDARLSAGDRVDVIDGRDRTEGTRQVRTVLPGLRPGNPEFSLATSKVLRVDTVGAVSDLLLGTAFRSVGRSRRPPHVALTFDDGPWPHSTAAILRILHRKHVKATFFVIGYLAQRYPGLIRAEARSGMTIGNHSWNHPTSLTGLRPVRLRREMSQTNDVLNHLRVHVHLFRPPGGGWNRDVVTTAHALGMRVVEWNVDPRDWVASTTRKELVRTVLRSVRPGSIIDLHDGGGDQSATVLALPAIIRGIRRMGLKLVALR